MNPSDQSKFSFKDSNISSGIPGIPRFSFNFGIWAEAADRVRNEDTSTSRGPGDKEAVGTARNWARPRRHAARPTKFTFLQPSTLESSAVKARKSESDGEMSQGAVPKKVNIQEEKEALKKRLGEIEVIELKELESLIVKKRADLKEMKNYFRGKLESAFAAVKALQAEEAVKCSELEKAIVDLAAEISNKKEKQPDESFRSCLECPICLEICKPPTQVWQCPEGHILCGSCAAKPEVLICPQCRVKLAGRLSRGRVLEEMARKIFSVD